MALGASGDLSSVGEGSGRAPAISLPMRDREADPPPAGRVRRFTKMRTTLVGRAGVRAKLIAASCAISAILASASISACSASSPSATPTTFSPGRSASATSSARPIGTASVSTPRASASPSSARPAASPSAQASPAAASSFPAAAPSTGGGGTAGFQDALLFGLGVAAILAGAGSIAYRRRVIRNR
jgi:hypothetical protein